MYSKKITEQEIHDASAGFYDVLLGSNWTDALLPLVPMFHAGGIHFLTFDTKRQQPQSLLGAWTKGSHAEALKNVAAYDDYYYKIDRRTAITVNNPIGLITNCREYCDDAFVRRDEVYQDYLIPNGYEFMMSVTVAARRDTSATIGILRSGEHGVFSGSELARFQPLVKHLGRVMQLQWHLDGLERKSFMQSQALNALDFGVLVVDERGHIRHLNEKMGQILRRIKALKIAHGRLRCDAAFDQSHLEQLLKLATHKGIGDGMVVSDSLTQQRWHLWIVPARDGLGMFNERLAIIAITNPSKPPSIDAILQRAFGFTFAEVKLVGALVAGVTVAEYAQREHISMTTARTHVRSVLSKAGVKRQTDLIRMVSGAGLISATSMWVRL